jgi:hypothetical protein
MQVLDAIVCQYGKAHRMCIVYGGIARHICRNDMQNVRDLFCLADDEVAQGTDERVGWRAPAMNLINHGRQ